MSANLLVVQIIEPTERGLIERFGKYSRYAEPGLHFLIPFVDTVRVVGTTENIKNVIGKEYITKDRLNCVVDAQVHYRVAPDEESVKNSEYNVYDHEYQIVQLATTTLRSIVGSLTFEQANEERELINGKLAKTLESETKDWGIEITRTEVSEIKPPASVQQAMNSIIEAESNKKASQERAYAAKIEAEGKKEAAIQEASGEASALKLRSEAQAKAIEIVNTAANNYFKENAQKLKRLEVTESVLKYNSKIFLPTGQDITLILGDSQGIIPVKKKE